MLRPTQDLAEALNRFDPLRPLQTTEELESFFTARAHSPLEPLISYLRVLRQPAHLLFMGHRGSGKSTELAKLASRMQNTFLVVNCRAGQVVNLNQVEPVDVVLACALAFLNAIAEENFIVQDKSLNDLESWLRNNVEIETIKIKRAEGSASFGVSLKTFTADLSAKFNRESATRMTLRPRLKTIVSELVERVNEVVKYVEDNYRPPLILVEDLDKITLTDAQKIFLNEGQLLRLLDCRMVYTFPIALRYSNDFAQVRSGFQKDFKLPNFSICHRDGSPDDEGRACLHDLVMKRADESLFEPGAVERAVELSGGLVADLVRLIQGGLLEAIVNSVPQVAPNMINSVASEIRSDFRAALRPPHYDALRLAETSRTVVNEEAVQEILHNLSLLEYRNSEDWVDVHPIAKPLLSSS